MFVIRWIYASYDYLSEVIDDILHNNWWVEIFKSLTEVSFWIQLSNSTYM